MKRRFEGLHGCGQAKVNELPDGVFLVRVERAQYRWHAQKPYYSLRFTVVQPKEFVGQSITGRLYCSQKALWKLSWFLRDFGYDAELFGHDEIDDKRLAGLQGVVKISRSLLNGRAFLNFDAFAPAAKWNDLSCGADRNSRSSEVA